MPASVRANFTADETEMQGGSAALWLSGDCLTPGKGSLVPPRGLQGTGSLLCAKHRAGTPLGKVLPFQGPQCWGCPAGGSRDPPPQTGLWHGPATPTEGGRGHSGCLVLGTGEAEHLRSTYPSHPGRRCPLTHQPQVIGVWSRRGLWPVPC